MKLVNLTHLTITMRDPNGTDTTVAPSGAIATVDQHLGPPETVPGVPVPIVTVSGGTITGLPDPEDDTLYITAVPVAAAAKRSDVVSPGTGPKDEAIRDSDGKIIAVTRLVRHS